MQGLKLIEIGRGAQDDRAPTNTKPLVGTTLTTELDMLFSFYMTWFWNYNGGLIKSGGTSMFKHWGRDKWPPFSRRQFLNGFSWIKMYVNRLKFHWICVPKGQINNIPALVQIMAWRWPGDKPLSEPRMGSLLTHICVTRSQRVKVRSCTQNTTKTCSSICLHIS